MQTRWWENNRLLRAVCLIWIFVLIGCNNTDWRTASRESAGIAPDPATTIEAVLHIYGADAWGWRGWFAIHTWIAAKGTRDTEYTVYDVTGWRGYHGQSVLKIAKDIPDRYWYGAKPRILKAHQGEGVDKLIAVVDQAARVDLNFLLLETDPIILTGTYHQTRFILKNI